MYLTCIMRDHKKFNCCCYASLMKFAAILYYFDTVTYTENIQLYWWPLTYVLKYSRLEESSPSNK